MLQSGATATLILPTAARLRPASAVASPAAARCGQSLGMASPQRHPRHCRQPFPVTCGRGGPGVGLLRPCNALSTQQAACPGRQASRWLSPSSTHLISTRGRLLAVPSSPGGSGCCCCCSWPRFSSPLPLLPPPSPPSDTRRRGSLRNTVGREGDSPAMLGCAAQHCACWQGTGSASALQSAGRAAVQPRQMTERDAWRAAPLVLGQVDRPIEKA